MTNVGAEVSIRTRRNLTKEEIDVKGRDN